MRVLLRSEKMKADVAAILNEAGWQGDLEDFDRAVAAAEITEIEIAPGTRLPFMASREKTRGHKPHVLMDVLWAGRKPIKAYAFDMVSKCTKYRVVMPAACGNFWFEETGKDDTGACAPPPPPPVVNVSSTGEACVTQPVEITVNVQNPPADGAITIALNGKELTHGHPHGWRVQGLVPRRHAARHLRGAGHVRRRHQHHEVRGEALPAGVRDHGFAGSRPRPASRSTSI